jgi:hypothetical protein
MAIHQWTFPRDPATIRNMPRCVEAMERIAKAIGIHAIDASSSKTLRTKDVITGKLEDGQTDRVSKAFDGQVTLQGADAGQLFDFPGTLSNSCDTGDKAYDLLVLACLAVAKLNLRSEITITSDASRGRWNQAVALASQVLGDSVPNPLDDVEESKGKV